MIPDKEIEKLADEFADKNYPKNISGHNCNLAIKIGYKAALSNPDYVVIKREDIEKRIKILINEYTSVVNEEDVESSQIFPSAIDELKNILSNSIKQS